MIKTVTILIIFLGLCGNLVPTEGYWALIVDVIGNFAGILAGGGLNFGKTNYCGVALGQTCTVRVYNKMPFNVEVKCESKDDTEGPKILEPGQQMYFKFGLKGTVGIWNTQFWCSVGEPGKPGQITFDAFNGDATIDDNHWYILEDGIFLENSIHKYDLFYVYPDLEPFVSTYTLWDTYDKAKNEPGGDKLEGSIKYKECINIPKEMNDKTSIITLCDHSCVIMYENSNCEGHTARSGSTFRDKKYLVADTDDCTNIWFGAFNNKASSVEGCYGGKRKKKEEPKPKEPNKPESPETPQPEDTSIVDKIKSCNKRIIGYYPSWGKGQFRRSQPRYLTHIVFAFFETHSDGRITLGSADPDNSEDIGQDANTAEKRLENFLEILRINPSLKGMFAVGGWENSGHFSSIAASGLKETFIQSVIQILEKYPFDGFDFDWEYPVTGGKVEGMANDKQNYVQLMKELRSALDGLQQRKGRSDKYLLSFAGAAGQWTLDPGYDLPSLLQWADWANVMSYDYFGAWGSQWGAYTGPPSPLFFGNPKGYSGKVNADWSIKYYVCKSKEPHKVNMGVPFYGRYWENVGSPIDPKDGMWRLAESVGGKYIGGYVPWKEISSNWISKPGFEVIMHEKAKVPYAFNPTSKMYIGFENPESLGYKMKYAENHNLGGIMIWALDQDDESDTMLKSVVDANLCTISDPKKIVHKCPLFDDIRWWTPENGKDKAGMCGKSAPLINGYYPICDADDPGYSCCGAFGYCGSESDFCDCPTCINYRDNPERAIEEPTKPSRDIAWYTTADGDGKRGRCGRTVSLLNKKVPICNADDPNTYCCSNGGYCGVGSEYCNCDGCVNYKERPNYEYPPKTWWAWEDGADKAGRCGPNAPRLPEDKMAECNPDSKESHCCSASGWCGSGDDFCNCSECVNYKK